MSKPKVFEKPSGVKDYLPDMAAKLRYIETHVLECMQRWGYREVITPTIEYYDTVGVASSTSDQKLFKLLDKKGTTIMLRSELTAPIARVVASLLKDHPLPLRLSYHSNVFRALEDEAGRDAEFYQTGVELVGDGSPEADAEIVALAIACLKTAGIEKFKMAIGHVGFLSGLFHETLNEDTDAQAMLKEYLLNRDYVGYLKQIQELSISDEARRKLEGILRLRGGQDICLQAQSLSKDPLAQSSIQHLIDVWNVLHDYGVQDRVMIDLTMIGDFSYYTGMTFEGYAADSGFPVCNGGRYDNLLKQFGRPAPATGFALKTNRILEVAHDISLPKVHHTLILYTVEQRAHAIAHAQQLRSREGSMVETRLVSPDEAANLSITRDHEDKYYYQGVLYDHIETFV